MPLTKKMLVVFQDRFDYKSEGMLTLELTAKQKFIFLTMKFSLIFSKNTEKAKMSAKGVF